MRSLFRIFSLFIASFGEINTIKSCSKELRELGESQWLGFIFSKKWKKPPNNTVVCRHIWLKCTNSFAIEVTAGTRKRHWDLRTDFTCDMSYIQVYCLFFLFLLSNSLSMPHVLKSPFSLAHFSQRLRFFQVPQCRLTSASCEVLCQVWTEKDDLIALDRGLHPPT